jgi:uncharacterized protein (DUF2062 family)
MQGGAAADKPPLQELELLFRELWLRAGDAVGRASGMSPDTALHASDAEIGQLVSSVLLPMALGAVPNVALVWLISYLPLRRLVAAYQHRRAMRRRKHWRPADGKAN